MKVYAIYMGSRYEAGQIMYVYSQKWKAIEKAKELVPKNQKWWETALEEGTVFAWQNTWKEIIVYEYPLL